MAEDSMIVLNAGDQAQGQIRVAPRVLELVAGIAAAQVDGVAKMHGSFTNSVSEMLGRSDYRRGVKLINHEDGLSLEVGVYVNYGASVPTVAAQIQEKIKQQVALMTNLEVQEVNVHVQGIVTVEKDDQGIDPENIFGQKESNGEE